MWMHELSLCCESSHKIMRLYSTNDANLDKNNFDIQVFTKLIAVQSVQLSMAEYESNESQTIMLYHALEISFVVAFFFIKKKLK